MSAKEGEKREKPVRDGIRQEREKKGRARISNTNTQSN